MDTSEVGLASDSHCSEDHCSEVVVAYGGHFIQEVGVRSGGLLA